MEFDPEGCPPRHREPRRPGRRRAHRHAPRGDGCQHRGLRPRAGASAGRAAAVVQGRPPKRTVRRARSRDAVAPLEGIESVRLVTLRDDAPRVGRRLRRPVARARRLVPLGALPPREPPEGALRGGARSSSARTASGTARRSRATEMNRHFARPPREALLDGVVPGRSPRAARPTSARSRGVRGGALGRPLPDRPRHLRRGRRPAGPLRVDGLPYVGFGVAASAVGMDKVLMKAVFARRRPAAGALRRRSRAPTWTSPAVAAARLRARRDAGPPALREAGVRRLVVGITKVKRSEDLEAAVDARSRSTRRRSSRRRSTRARSSARSSRAKDEARPRPPSPARSCRGTSSTTTRTSTSTTAREVVIPAESRARRATRSAGLAVRGVRRPRRRRLRARRLLPRAERRDGCSSTRSTRSPASRRSRCSRRCGRRRACRCPRSSTGSSRALSRGRSEGAEPARRLSRRRRRAPGPRADPPGRPGLRRGRPSEASRPEA